LIYDILRLVAFFLCTLQCKFDFCWVCLENWKKHSSATGGYFRCNRFEAVHKADEKQGILISEVRKLINFPTFFFCVQRLHFRPEIDLPVGFFQMLVLICPTAQYSTTSQKTIILIPSLEPEIALAYNIFGECDMWGSNCPFALKNCLFMSDWITMTEFQMAVCCIILC